MKDRKAKPEDYPKSIGSSKDLLWSFLSLSKNPSKQLCHPPLIPVQQY